MKRKAGVFLALLLTFFLSAPGLLAEISPDSVPPEKSRVTDRADVLTASEEDALEEAIANIREAYQFDVVLLTETGIGNQPTNYYAADYYDYGGFGYGENHDGIMLLLVTGGGVGNRDYFIMNTGRGEEVFTDSVMYDMEDNFLPYLRISNYAAGMAQFVRDVQVKLEEARIKQQPFSYKNAFSFGMTVEEVEAQCELSFLQEGSPFIDHVPRNFAENNRFYLEYSAVNMVIEFVFIRHEDSSSLEEILVAFRDINSAYREIHSLEADYTEAEDLLFDSSALDYEAIEQTLCRKYGDADETDKPMSLFAQNLATLDESFISSQVVRRVLTDGPNILVIDHFLIGSSSEESRVNTISYRSVSPKDWAVYQYQQSQEQLEKFLDDML